ncbi:MAG: histidine phosphatase family protein [Candidatus Saccharimonas sp.]
MIYFIRHAQSEANKKGIYAGSLNSPLTSGGISRFRAFSRRNEKVFGKIYVSQLSRSIESGRIFQSEQSYDSVLLIDPRANELNFGKLAGRPYISLDSQHIYDEYDIESKEAFYNRVKNFYDDIRYDENDALIIGHAGVAKMLQTIINDKPIEDYNKAKLISAYEIYQL